MPLTGALLKSTALPESILATSPPGDHHWRCRWGRLPGARPCLQGEGSMKVGSLTRQLGLAVVAFVLVAACGSTGGGGSASCSESTVKTATTASGCGGMDALVAAAKAEKELNVIALPPDWANYGAIISGFEAKYGIHINSANPNGSSQEEVDAINQLSGTTRAPDVVDVGMKVALANTALFAPYQVAKWGDILPGQKE